ncbi:MAG TPA: MFS transporter, partial [Lacunisphaera sp.]
MSHRHHHITAPEDRIPLREKIGFTLGGIGLGGTNHIVFGLLMPIFNMTLGVSPALISTAGFIQSMLTSWIDPFLGQFSDNFRSRWGRRRLLMLIFAVPLALADIGLFWFPRGASENFLFYWLVTILPLITLLVTSYGVSFGALSIEATTDYHERVRLGVFTGLAGGIFGIGYQWLFPLIQQPFYGTVIDRLRIVTTGIGVLCLFMLLAPLFLCPEKRYEKQTKTQARTPLLRNLPEVARNKPFLIVASIKFFTFFCYTTVGVLGTYMNTYFIYGGDLRKASITYGILGTSYVVA